MTKPMTPKQVRRWYHKAGLEYNEEDWGPRFESGESAGKPEDMRERRDLVGTHKKVTAFGPGNVWWENQHYPWRPRTDSELEWYEVLEEFFVPYLSLLPKAKGNLLMEVFADQRTLVDLGTEASMTRQGAHKAKQSAVRALTRRIAEDDPLGFRAPLDKRRRDYEEENRAARRVFMVYLSERGLT